jgi:ATPase family protein associated with various cellular activities (AAA)
METSEIENDLMAGTPAESKTNARSVALPPETVLVEQVTAALRRFLADEGLDAYTVFVGLYDDLHDLDRHLTDMDPAARWAAHEILTGDCQAPGLLVRGAPQRILPSGLLVLSAYRLVIVRKFWLDRDGDWRTLFLCAAFSPAEYERFRNDLRASRHDHGGKAWQIVRGAAYLDGDRIPRPPEIPEPLLPQTVMSRLHCDVIQFFSPEVEELHRAMNVPYRRGVLLHGPPGNGKTSTIRYLGAMLPRIPGLILRPKSNFDTDDFEAVVNRWRKAAPAMLVIEDLNWLLEEVNVSTFLNLIDGVDSTTTPGGLLLLATTNHPDQLDPAINSRPGRFDTVIELPPPDLALRKKFFARALDEIPPDVIRRLAGNTSDMSFAHLEEIVRLSGLLAIKSARRHRSLDDLEEALTSVKKSIAQAKRGFAHDLEVPFGLRPRARVE